MNPSGNKAECQPRIRVWNCKKKIKKKRLRSSGLWAAAPKHSRQLAGALIIAGLYTNTQACSCVCLLRLPRCDSSQGERMRNARIFKDSPLLPSAAASTIQCPKILLSVCLRVCVSVWMCVLFAAMSHTVTNSRAGACPYIHTRSNTRTHAHTLLRYKQQCGQEGSRRDVTVMRLWSGYNA